jgi:hypothetical protein
MSDTETGRPARAETPLHLLRAAFHGFVLTVLNLVGLIVGFVAAANSGPDNRVTLQLAVAILYSILLFLAWSLSLRNLPSRFSRGARLQGPREHVLAYAASLLWNPLLLIPLHFVTQGYLTSAGNIVALLFFQLPVNAVAVLCAGSLSRLQPNPQS